MTALVYMPVSLRVDCNGTPDMQKPAESGPALGLLLGLSGVKVGDDGWRDRRVGGGLKHCDNHPDNISC